MSVIDEEDRYYAARCAKAPDGWPFDADRDDPLTAHRIAVTSSHPSWAYLLAFDRESKARPTDAETAMFASFLEYYKTHWYGDNGYRRAMERRPLDVDGSSHAYVFHKWAADDWGYRQQSYTRGWPFSLVPPTRRQAYAAECSGEPYTLLALLDRLCTANGVIEARDWQAWKAARPDVFGPARRDDEGRPR